MTEVCSDCTKPLARNPRRNGTRCPKCTVVARNKDPQDRARRGASIKARLADPAYRALHVKRTTEGLRRALKEKPELVEIRRESARRIGSSGRGIQSYPAGSEPRLRAGRTKVAREIAWCPLEYRERYRELVYSKCFKAAEAKSMILQLIEADRRRYLATGKLQATASPKESTHV